MKQIKLLIMIIVLGLASSLFAQSQDPQFFKHISLTDIDFDTAIVDVNTTFGALNFNASRLTFSIYNQTTKLNDNYTVVNDNYTYDSSSAILENSRRGHKIDSFNPYGASNVTSAVGLGLVNGLLKKLQD